MTDGDAVTNDYKPSNTTQQWVKSDNRIVNRFDPSQCLDIKRARDKDGAKIVAYEYKALDNQHWEFEYI